MQDNVLEAPEIMVPPNKHGRHFLRAWIRSPIKMGAVVPSSRWLARAMAGQVDPTREGVVIELGAGTGVVTRELLGSGIDTKRLLIIEREPKLHAMLKAHYPKLNIICSDALDLDKTLESQSVSNVSAIVSSLPLLSMPRMLRRGIIEQMVLAIGETGEIIQFTYGPGSPIGKYSLDKFSLAGKRVRTVIANVPPAHVWVYSKVIR